MLCAVDLTRDAIETLCTHHGLRPDTSPSESLPRRRRLDPGEALTDADLAGTVPADDFEWGEHLATGGLSRVILARQRSLDRVVAAKVVRADRDDRSTRATLVREARLAAQMDHPNVNPIYALVWDDGPRVVMKRIAGRSWREQLRDGDGATRDAVEVLIQVCRAVEYAHARGVLHRDIKPANVMLGAFGEVTLIDWGTALDVAHDPPEAARELVGTPGYMPPEVLDPEQAASVAADVFMLGACLHEVLTGAPRHGGATLSDVLCAATRCEAARYPSDAPPGLVAICEVACAREPARRHADVAQLRRALEDWLVHEASLRTTVAAEAELTRLRALVAQAAAHGDPAPVHAQLQTCRYAFGRALEAWRNNEAARVGLDASLRVVAELELAQGRAQAAVTLLSEMAAPPVELSERAAVTAAQDAARTEQAERLRAAASEAQTLSGRVWPSLAVYAALSLGSTLWQGAAWRRGLALPPGSAVLVLLVAAVSTVGWMVWKRAELPALSRLRLVVTAYAGMLVVGAGLAFTLRELGIDYRWYGAVLGVMGTQVWLTLAVAVDRALWMAVALAAAATLASAVWPWYWHEIIGVASALGSLYVARLLWRAGRTP